MKVFFQIAALGSVLTISGPALAQQANEGVPFGKGVVAPAAQDKSLVGAVHAEGPGNVDDKIHNNLADNESDGMGGNLNVRGHGKDAAPGQQ